MFRIQGSYNEAVVYAELQDPKAVSQLKNLCEDKSYSQGVIRIMPDYHAASGCVIGLSLRLPAATLINPQLVGVDLGCGVYCVKLNRRPDFDKLDRLCRANLCGPADAPSETAGHLIDALRCRSRLSFKEGQLGTLGSGNYFVEIDEFEHVYYLLIHSGSRNLGYEVASLYIQDYLEEKLDLEDYLHDLALMQEYARLNRQTMAELIQRKLKLKGLESLDCMHNFIELTDTEMTIRKGAISAKKDELCVIPLNMRDGTILARGKGNAEWNCSAPHGAGRAVARSEARSHISLEKYERCMQGIYSSTVSKATLEEAPQAYKPVKSILSAIVDTVEILGVMKSCFNFKPSD